MAFKAFSFTLLFSRRAHQVGEMNGEMYIHTLTRIAPLKPIFMEVLKFLQNLLTSR